MNDFACSIFPCDAEEDEEKEDKEDNNSLVAGLYHPTVNVGDSK